MKLLKRMAVCLLAAAMALSMLTACDDGGDAPAASSNPPASSGSTDTGTKDPDPPASTEPTKPALPTTWAETRTSAYFTRLGVSAENVYEEYEGVVEGYPASIKCAAKDGKLYWEGTDISSTDDSYKHIANYMDAAGNGYNVTYDTRDIQKYDAGTSRAKDLQQELNYMVRAYILIPEAADVATVSATEQYQYDGRYYYAESIKARMKVYDQTVTAEWDYLFDGDELKYVVAPEGSTLKVQKIEADPADSVFALPDWYSENVTASRTSQYFKSKGVLSDRYTIEVSVQSYPESDYKERRLVTVDGQKAFFSNSFSSDPSIGEFYRGELINGSNSEYYQIDYQGKYCYGPRTIDQSTADNLKTAWSVFIIPDASNTAYMTSGTEKVGLKTYYKESFYLRNSTNDSVIEFYFDGADGMELAYIKNGRQTTTIESISGTPRTDLLKLPEGFTQYSFPQYN